MKTRYVIALFLGLGLLGAFDAWLDPLFDRLSRATVAASPRGNAVYEGDLGGLHMQLNRAEVCAMGESMESYLSASESGPIMDEMRDSMRDMDDIHWQVGRTTLINAMMAKGLSESDARTTIDGLRLMQVYDREC